jgi:glyoxylase-like metal-dependent hydrolase (beta-lactamase superfamily II)
MIPLGDLRLYPLLDGTFRLDGGAMFGIVPKPLWERLVTPDDRNRVLIALRPLLIETPDRRILIDTGMGSRWDDKMTGLLDLRRSPDLSDSLRASGFAPADIDLVVLTHLHFDHAGGAVTRGAAGDLVPAFPRATYVIQRGEWEAAARPNERTRASYRADDFLPIEAAGRVRFVDGDVEVAPGVELVRTGGHVRDHCIVKMRGGGRTAVYWADLVPTTAHLRPAYTMGFDLYPLEVVEQRKALIAQALKEGWICFFEHDPSVAVGFLKGDPAKPDVDKIA